MQTHAPNGQESLASKGRAAFGTTGDAARADRIRALNDELRRTFTGGRVMISAGVMALPAEQRLAVFLETRRFDAFDRGNDPYGEHDFGRVEINGAGYFWKIDYFAPDLEQGSPDPSDDTATTRVMTIMREDEY